MIKKLTKHGNSLALIIDKPLLQLLKITEKSDLEITIKDHVLTVQLANPQQKENRKFSSSEVREMAKEIMQQYDEVFKRLSKT